MISDERRTARHFRRRDAQRGSGTTLPGQFGTTADGVPAGVGTGRAARRAVGDRRSRPPARLLPARRCCATPMASRCSSTCCPTSARAIPTSSPIFPAANRMQRSAFDLVGVQCDADDQRPWTWQAAWPIDQFPLRRDFEASPKWEPGQEDYPFVRVSGDGVHEIPGRTGSRRNHRARALPLSGGRRKGAAARGAARLRAQGHREALRGAARRRRPPARGPGFRRQHGRLRLGVRAGSRSDDRRDGAATRAVAARALPGARAHRQSSRRSRLSRQRRRIRVRTGAVLAAEGGCLAAERARPSAIAC